jgi:hypothetical protein
LFDHGDERIPFGAEFNLGFDINWREYFQDEMREAFQEISELLTGIPVLNYHSETVVLPTTTPQHVLDTIDEKFGVVYGPARIFGESQRFAYQKGDEFNMRGIAAFSSNKGEKCQYERDFFEGFFTRVLSGDVHEALEFAYEKVMQYYNGTVARSDLIFTRKAARDFHTYSGAASVPWKKPAEEQGVQENEVYVYEKSSAEMKDRLFGEKGTITDKVLWLFGSRPKQSAREAVYHLMEGKAVPFDIIELQGAYEHTHVKLQERLG